MATIPADTTLPANITLLCVVINRQRAVLLQPFGLNVPTLATCGVIFTLLKVAIPALRDEEDPIFELYKPLTSIAKSSPLNELTEAQVDLGNPLHPSSHSIQEMRSHDPHGVHAIICLHLHNPGPVSLISSQASFGPHSLVKIVLPPGVDIRGPGEHEVTTNNVWAAPATEITPRFVAEFEVELLSRRFADPNMMPDYTQFLKAVFPIGNTQYSTYFTDKQDGVPTPARLTLLESIHYNLILFDKQILSSIAYRVNKEAHVYSLLSRISVGVEGSDAISFNKAWPFHLLIERGNRLSRYQPRSDFCMVVNSLPVLLLEVNSDARGGDRRRMLLQGACLVRLGNSLLKPKSRFLVKAIYIDEHYRAVEYTMYRQENQSDVNKIVYKERQFELFQKDQAFEFIFRLYNFHRWSTTTMQGKFSSDSPLVVSFLDKLIDAADPPPSRTASNTRSRGRRTNQMAQDGPASRGNALALTQFAQEAGYTLLDHDKGSAIIKACKNSHVVAMKLLPGRRQSPDRRQQGLSINEELLSSNDELTIILGLQKLDSPQNHTIKVFHTYHSDHADSSYDIIVMPWHSSLDGFLSGFPTTAESLWHQFLEGVSFLHDHGIAHLDLKPGNVLVGAGFTESSQPRLSIIDFGISVRVESDETKVQGYRGTLCWTAPEVGMEVGPSMTYSPILADRWSCGRVLQHIRKFHPTGDISMYLSIQDQLLSPDPSSRPSLHKVLDGLQGHNVTYPVKRGSPNSVTEGTFIMQKRLKGSPRSTRSQIKLMVHDGRP